MKTIKFVAFLFYRYYTGGRRPDSTPYFRTLGSMTLLGYIYLMQILIILNKVDVFIPIKSSDSLWRKRLIMLLVLIPIFIVLNLIVRKKELEKLKQENFYEKNALKKGNVWLIVYTVLSFALLILLAILIKRN